jgi:hypothetical protein
MKLSHQESINLASRFVVHEYKPFVNTRKHAMVPQNPQKQKISPNEKRSSLLGRGLKPCFRPKYQGCATSGSKFEISLRFSTLPKIYERRKLTWSSSQLRKLRRRVIKNLSASYFKSTGVTNSCPRLSTVVLWPHQSTYIYGAISKTLIVV